MERGRFDRPAERRGALAGGGGLLADVRGIEPFGRVQHFKEHRGLVALGAVILGAARAPLLPVLWTVLVLWWAPPMGDPPTHPQYTVMLTWMVQPNEVRPATAAAIALATAGTLAYAVFGSRR